jgi:hypothetical protein
VIAAMRVSLFQKRMERSTSLNRKEITIQEKKKIHYKIQFIHYNQGQPLVFPVSTNSWLKRAFLGGLAFSDGRSALQIEEPAWTASN